MIFVQSNEFEVSHRETALLGADPGAFLPGVNLVRIRMISKRTMMTLLKLMPMPSSYPLPVSASLGLFPPALRKLLLDCFRDTFVSSSSLFVITIVFPFKESIITSFFFPAAAIGS